MEERMPDTRSVPHRMSEAHVLVLEDETLILMDLEQTLREMGCLKVTAVTSAVEAIAAIDKEYVHLALLDIHLQGGGTSLEVARALKTLGIPFFFTSGSEGEDVPDEFSRIPFFGKPFDTSSLQ